jgi:uncharacterized protein (TIGR02757 family)
MVRSRRSGGRCSSRGGIRLWPRGHHRREYWSDARENEAFAVPISGATPLLARRGPSAVRRLQSPELVALLDRLAAAIAKHGSLGALFRSGYDASAADIAPSLARFVAAIRDAVPARSAREMSAIGYLLSSPDDGSACKRMNLFLRWMIRRTSPDLGLWTFADPAKLVMPLDTHVHRIATFLGLNDRRTTDWKTARALTDRLATLDPADPVRYDFALCRLGILDLCSRRRRKEQCDVCLLRDVCRFPVE